MYLPALLKKLENVTRELARLEGERAALRAQIRETATNPPRRSRRRATQAERVELIRQTVAVLQLSEHPLPPREIAHRLGISLAAASYRLRTALDMKLVERVGNARYRVATYVPAA